MHSIDRHAWTNAWSSHHPAEKVFLACGALFLSLLLPPISGGIPVLAVMSAVILLGARIPWRTYLAFMLLPTLFLMPGAAVIAVHVDLAPFSLRVPPEGMLRATEVVSRSLAGFSCLALLTLTTPFTDLLPRLRRLCVPDAVLEVMLLMYRLTFVAVGLVQNGYRAQWMRAGYASLGGSVRAAGLLGAGLLLGTLVRTRRLAIGLQARDHNGVVDLLPRPAVLSYGRLACNAILLIALVGVAVWLQHPVG